MADILFITKFLLELNSIGQLLGKHLQTLCMDQLYMDQCNITSCVYAKQLPGKKNFASLNWVFQ